MTTIVRVSDTEWLTLAEGVGIGITCNQCGHDMFVDAEESAAPDVPDDEIFIRCSQEGHPNCDAKFVKVEDIL